MSKDEVPAHITAAVIKKFEGEYEAFQYINAGGTAYVWAVTKKDLGQRRIIKVMKPQLGDIVVTLVDTGEKVNKSLPEIFRREMNYIVALSDEHILKIFEVGSIPLSADEEDLSYLVVEFVRGHNEIDAYLEGEKRERGLKEAQFVGIIKELASAVAACHKEGIGHGDIKPGNVLIDDSGKVKLADFGFAKALAELEGDDDGYTLCCSDVAFMPELLTARMANQLPENSSGKPIDPRATPVAIKRGDLRKVLFRLDLVMLGKTIEALLKNETLKSVVVRHAGFLTIACKRLTTCLDSDSGRYRSPGCYQSSEQFLADLIKIQSGYAVEGVFEEFATHPYRGVSLPVSGTIAFTPRLVRILEHRMFRRLRGVRQLGLTHLLYPGAQHSRFEHSLGVYGNVTLFVRALWRAEGYPYFSQVVTEQDIKALMVAALLHDVGHFPMAHAFEEIEPTNVQELRHDQLAQRMLTGALEHVVDKQEADDFGNMLWDDWGVSPKDVIAIMRGRPLMAENVQKNVVTLLHSIIDGPLDADRLDYLQRDSVHTGNDAGLGIDRERFFQNLVAPELAQSIGIREDGVPAAETILMARYRMYRSVYWHRKNRALERMVTEAVRIIRRSRPAEFIKDFEAVAFRSDDEELLRQIANWLHQPNETSEAYKRNEQIAEDLIFPLMAASGERRRTYRRLIAIARGGLVWSHTERDAGLHNDIIEFFQAYLDTTNVNRWRYPLFEIEVRRRLLELTGTKGIRAHEILLDVPDPRGEAPARDGQPTPPIFLVFSHGHTSGTDIRSGDSLYGSVLNSWRDDIRKFRVFCSPKAMEALEGKKVKQEIRAAADEIKQLANMRSDEWQRLVDDGWAALANI